MIRWFAAVGLSVLSIVAACSRGDGGVAQQQTRGTSAASGAIPSRSSPRDDVAKPRSERGARSNIGFRSSAQFNEHFQKHGSEFGHVTQQQYLREAQDLRDAPVGGNVEEIRRDDGTTSRFDRSTGAFLAFNRDGTIRTFFKPNDGEAYFRRQASRVH